MLSRLHWEAREPRGVVRGVEQIHGLDSGGRARRGGRTRPARADERAVEAQDVVGCGETSSVKLFNFN